MKVHRGSSVSIGVLHRVTVATCSTRTMMLMAALESATCWSLAHFCSCRAYADLARNNNNADFFCNGGGARHSAGAIYNKVAVATAAV